MFKQLLHDQWQVRAVGDLSEVPAPLRGLVLPAKIPGCVHTDLLRAGKIPDPYKDFNEMQLRWIGHTDWEFSCEFEADEKLFAHERIDLAADGLDTVARILLNDQLVAETFNMHRGYRFDVRPMLKRGRNTLTITFASPVKYANAMREKLGPRPYVNGPAGPFNFIRKMACNFGWDWGPALPTCGIWRGIRLEGWTGARIADVSLAVVEVERGSAIVRRAYRLEETGTRGTTANWSIHHREQRISAPSMADDEENDWYIEHVVIPDAQVWWPQGHGQQPLYKIRLNLHHWKLDSPVGEDHEAAGSWEGWIGLRTIELDTSSDDIGREFVIKVNNKPIFCKGFNWIPDDCFLDRATDPARVRQRIQQAVDAGANMLRVWGGGIFETDDFYNICDEMGVLVWQDFLFACAMYPEEEPFKSEVEAEARYNVARLAHHPSLAIWNGCNENIWAYRDWGWKDDANVQKLSWGKGYYFDLLPKICKELTPTIPYWAGSPWSGDYDVDNGVPPNAATHGNKHVWEAWFKEDYGVYRNFAPRFCSEFGFQGPATYSSIASVVPENARDFGSPEMRHRQKSGDPVRDDGDRRNLRHLIRHFNLPGAQELLDALESPDPKGKIPECGAGPLHSAKPRSGGVNFDDLHYLLQVNQARALTLGVEWFRSRQPTCMGALYWQLNDCWPGGTTWSCIDGDGKFKPLWYATRNFYTDVLYTIQPDETGTLHLYLINDCDKPQQFSRAIRRFDFDGKELAKQVVKFDVSPRSVASAKLNDVVSRPVNAAREYLTAGFPVSAYWFFLSDRELQYSTPQFISEWDGIYLTIRAQTLLRDVCIYIDRLDPDATISGQLATIPAGGAFTFEIRSQRSLTLEQLTSLPAFQCVNRFGRGETL